MSSHRSSESLRGHGHGYDGEPRHIFFASGRDGYVHSLSSTWQLTSQDSGWREARSTKVLHNLCELACWIHCTS
eukprot:3273205-Amphidinium_carterae.1